MPEPLIRPLPDANASARHRHAVAGVQALLGALSGRTDPPDVHVVDAAVPFARLTAARYGALLGRPYAGPDWRITLVWGTGEETTMHAGATAADALEYLDQREARRNG